MPTREWPLRIQDIIDSITKIQRLTVQKTFEEFEADEAILGAVLYCFIIIGEAAVNVPATLQNRYPHIPWRLMTDMRNVMAHEYFQVEFDRVWRTLQNHLPALVPQLQDLLRSEGIK